MKILRFSVATLGAFALVSGGLTIAVQRQGSGAQSNLRGAWKIVERITTGPNASTNRNPQPSMWVFTDRHYCYVRDDSSQPRSNIVDTSKAGADELRSVWGPFAAQCGTYEADGNVLTTRGIVAKIPSFMSPGAFQTWSYKLDGTTLVATQKATQDGPLAAPMTVKMTRVE